MIHANLLNCLTLALTISSWMPMGVLSAPMEINVVQPRAVPTPGEPVSDGL